MVISKTTIMAIAFLISGLDHKEIPAPMLLRINRTSSETRKVEQTGILQYFVLNTNTAF